MRRFRLGQPCIASGVAVLILSAVIIIQNNSKKAADTELLVPLDKTVIATCPSCLDIANRLDSDRYEIMATNSTAESIALIQSGRADAILSGRTLKPDEPLMDGHVIQDGYSFLSRQEMTVTDSELHAVTMYTDLDPETMRRSFGVENVTAVDDVYQHLDQGIAVTTWDNTDYTRAASVHVVTDTGDRLALSRRPTLYCPVTCNSTLQADIVALSKKLM